MVKFNDWCMLTGSVVGDHGLRVLTGEPAKLVIGIEATAAVIPGHYAAEEHISRVLARLGKPKAAALIECKLPTDKRIRSGDLGVDGHWFLSGGGHEKCPLAVTKTVRWRPFESVPLTA